MSVPPQSAASADPSMEDILASIRRILSEDEAPGAAPTPPTQAPTAAPTPAPLAPHPAAEASDVLTLDASMMVAESTAPVHAAPAVETFSPPPIAPAPPLPPAMPPAPPMAAEPPPAHRESPPAVLPPVATAAELADLMDFDPPPRAAPQPPPALVEPARPAPPPAEPARYQADEEAGLVAPEAAAAAASSMGSLIRRLAAERATPVYRGGGPTIEDLVRDEMRPMLKEWLDAHLPAMVERLVRAEIERVVTGSFR